MTTPRPTTPAVWAEAWLQAQLDDTDLCSLTAATCAADAIHDHQPVPEALRQVAIHAEDHPTTSTGYGTARWPFLRALYLLAAQHDPTDPRIPRSAAVSATRLVEEDPEGTDTAQARHAAADAEVFARRALALAPDDPESHYTLALAIYDLRPDGVPEALTYFEAAASLDPNHGWAQLYRAHCLHDLQRWREAADAYTDLPEAPFGKLFRWRLILAEEQRAYCLYRAGDTPLATRLYEEVLERWEEAIQSDEDAFGSDVLFVASPDLLFEAAEAGALPSLSSRVDSLRTALRGA